MEAGAQHFHHSFPPRGRELDSVALSATLHCLTGCAIGEIAGMVLGTALGLSQWGTVALSVALAFVFGYSLTSLPLLRAGLALGAVVPIAFGVVGFLLAWAGLADAGHAYEKFLLVIAYWIAPWLGVVLVDQLARFGVAVQVCPDGAEALMTLGVSCPEVILLAPATPMLTRHSFVRVLRRRHHMPVIIGVDAATDDSATSRRSLALLTATSRPRASSTPTAVAATSRAPKCP